MKFEFEILENDIQEKMKLNIDLKSWMSKHLPAVTLKDISPKNARESTLGGEVELFQVILAPAIIVAFFQVLKLWLENRNAKIVFKCKTGSHEYEVTLNSSNKKLDKKIKQLMENCEELKASPKIITN